MSVERTRDLQDELRELAEAIHELDRQRETKVRAFNEARVEYNRLTRETVG